GNSLSRKPAVDTVDRGATILHRDFRTQPLYRQLLAGPGRGGELPRRLEIFITQNRPGGQNGVVRRKTVSVAGLPWTVPARHRPHARRGGGDYDLAVAQIIDPNGQSVRQGEQNIEACDEIRLAGTAARDRRRRAALPPQLSLRRGDFSSHAGPGADLLRDLP